MKETAIALYSMRYLLHRLGLGFNVGYVTPEWQKMYMKYKHKYGVGNV